MTPYGQVDHTCSFFHLAINKSQIYLADLSHLKLTAEALVGKAVLCHDHCARGILVKAVYNARTNLVTNPFKTGKVKEQRIHKGPVLVTSPGMDHESRGLVQNDHVLVFVQNGKGNRFRLTSDGFLGRNFGSDNIPRLGQIPRFSGMSTDGDVTGANQPAYAGAREGGQAGGNNGIKSVPNL
jgi:hypothetical protein